jgi:hypothetical protein
MNEQDREDTLLLNVALGTDLLTSYVAATDDEPDEPPRKTGCVPWIIGTALLWLLWRCL